MTCRASRRTELRKQPDRVSRNPMYLGALTILVGWRVRWESRTLLNDTLVVAAFFYLSREARIVWLHAGWDLTGERTVALMRGLLERHANLAMSIKYDHGGVGESAPFLPRGGELRPGWIAMLREYPDRFMIGSDQFLGDDSERLEGARRLVDALPPDLKIPIASDNAKRIYRLDTG